MAISSGSKQIISGSSDGKIKLWDALTGEFQKTLVMQISSLLTVAFSPNNEYIPFSSSDFIKYWNATTGMIRKALASHENIVTTVAFPPDKKQIVSGFSEGVTKLWNATTSDWKDILAGHKSRIKTDAFRLDGKQIASHSNDITIKLWDVAKVLQALKSLGLNFGGIFKYRSYESIGARKEIQYIKFSADTRYLLTENVLFSLSKAPTIRRLFSIHFEMSNHEPFDMLWSHASHFDITGFCSNILWCARQSTDYWIHEWSSAELLRWPEHVVVGSTRSKTTKQGLVWGCSSNHVGWKIQYVRTASYWCLIS